MPSRNRNAGGRSRYKATGVGARVELDFRISLTLELGPLGLG